MSFVAITIEGGLLAADLLERLGAAPDGVEGQRGHDFGYFGPRLTEEIQAAFADLKSYWTTFQARRQRGSENLTALTRQVWVSQLLGRLRYELDFQRSAAEIGGVRYPISHRAAADMAILPVHVVSWQQDLGKTEGGKISPHPTAAAAVLNFTRYPTIETNAGLGFELKVIAAVVVGGTAITGGRGSLFGTLLGVVLLGTIGTVFTFLHVNPAWERAIQGAIILLAVVGDTAWRRGQARA